MLLPCALPTPLASSGGHQFNYARVGQPNLNCIGRPWKHDFATCHDGSRHHDAIGQNIDGLAFQMAEACPGRCTADACPSIAQSVARSASMRSI